MTIVKGWVVGLQDDGSVLVRLPQKVEVMSLLHLGDVTLVQDEKNSG